jgi:hypothetical protein
MPEAPGRTPKKSKISAELLAVLTVVAFSTG